MVVNDRAALPQELQLEVLACVVRDKVVMCKFSDVLREEYFDSPIHRLIYRLTKGYFAEFKRVPLQRTLQNEIQRVLEAERTYVPDAYFWAEVNRVFSFVMGDRDYVVRRVEDFLIRREVSELDRRCQEGLSSPERLMMSPLSQQFRKIATMLAGGATEGAFILRDADHMVIRSDESERIPTGFRKLDKALGGGLSVKELGVILAPTGRGKSATLIQLGLNAMRIGKRVFHVTFELCEEKVKARYVASLTRIAKDRLVEEQDRIRRKLKSIRRVVSPADVHIKEWPSQQCTIDMLRGYILELQLKFEFDPDLIIVDYADLMKPDFFYHGGEPRHILGAIYTTLRGLSMELNKAILTASQTNRAGLSCLLYTSDAADE